MKIASLLSRGVNLVISLLVSMALFWCGSTIAFTFGGEQRREVRRLEQLPVQDAAMFVGAATGSDMIVTGVLDGNKPQHRSGLVAYAQERWDVEFGGEGGHEGKWNAITAVWPSLLVLTSSGRIRTAAVNSADYGGDTYIEIIRYSDSRTKAEGIPDGSTRVVGYVNGATLTVVGHKNGTGLLVPSRLYGGTPKALITEQKQTIWFFAGLGTLLIFCAIVILILASRRLLTVRTQVSQ